MLAIQSAFSEWSQFDCDEYARRNYTGEILHEDRAIVAACIARLNTLAGGSSFERYIDVGSGPNLYPAMIVGSWVAEGGEIVLSDYVDSNREYLRNALSADTALSEWSAFERLICEVGGPMYRRALDRLKQSARVEFADVFAMPADYYDAVSAFFVAESITSQVERFAQATESLIASLRPGGIFVVAHMVRSTGWYAGLSTCFPAVSLTVEQIEQAYANQSCISVDVFRHDGTEAAARAGYEGMALVTGRRAQP